MTKLGWPQEPFDRTNANLTFYKPPSPELNSDPPPPSIKEPRRRGPIFFLPMGFFG